MKGAVIDLGTNTFNLLIFRKEGAHFEFIYNQRMPVGLGMGGINENKIAQDAFDRGVHAIIQFKQTCDKHAVEQIKAFGTSALRGAKNCQLFCEAVCNQTGIQIEIIAGLREAELIFEGVKLVHPFTKPSCIMDIGGGSTEFILVNEKGMQEFQSFDIGVSRMLQKFELSDPLTKENIQQIETFLAENTSDFFTTHSCEVLIGASGSFETFFEFIFEKKYTDEWNSSELTMEVLMEVLELLIHSTQEERQTNDHISDIRKKMIHIAALKTRWVIQQLNVKEAWISPASLKEGVMSVYF
jgi:exopolyphosphatase/guanosine-5'-triphosphate,3'-diphosphate pyrophosphatase